MSNHEEKWLGIKEVVTIYGSNRMYIWRLIQTGKFKIRWVRSCGCKGARIEIALSSLPERIQDRYWEKEYPVRPRPPEDASWLPRLSDRQRDIMWSRRALLDLLNEELDSGNGKSKEHMIAEFVRKYNAAEVDAAILEKLGPRSVRTINRWRCDYMENGEEGLVPGWTSGTFEDVPIDDKAFIDTYYLNGNKPSVAYVWRKYKEAGFDTLTYPRLRSYIKRMPEPVKCRWRDGKKAFEDLFGQYIERDYSQLKANEIWVGDHRQLDFAISGINGRPLFPWVTVWQDIRSRKIMEFCIHHTPCTETIVASFRSAILKHGLPEHVLIDNGKDFSSRRFSGGRRRFKLEIDEKKVMNLVHGLGVKTHFCNPYNARSKPVERTFRTMKEDFDRQWETYRGGNVKERPETLDLRLKDGSNLPTLPEVDAALQAWASQYNARPHCGQAMDERSPDQVWQETLGEKREADPERLRLAMMVAEDRMICRNGIRIFGQVYWHEAMWRYKGQRVRVRYDVHDLGSIDVYDQEENRFLFTAESKVMAQWLMCQDDIKKATRERREERKQVEAYANVLQRGRRGMPATSRAIQMKRDALIRGQGTGDRRQEGNRRQEARDGRQEDNLGMEDEENGKLHTLVKQRKELCRGTAEGGSDDGTRRPIFKWQWEKDDWERRQRARADAGGEETGEVHR